MGKMSDLHILLTGLVDDGLESGYFGNRLKEYVMDEAVTNYRIPTSLKSLVELFVDGELAECEKEIFND